MLIFQLPHYIPHVSCHRFAIARSPQFHGLTLNCNGFAPQRLLFSLHSVMFDLISPSPDTFPPIIPSTICCIDWIEQIQRHMPGRFFSGLVELSPCFGPRWAHSRVYSALYIHCGGTGRPRRTCACILFYCTHLLLFL